MPLLELTPVEGYILQEGQRVSPTLGHCSLKQKLRTPVHTTPLEFTPQPGGIAIPFRRFISICNIKHIKVWNLQLLTRQRCMSTLPVWCGISSLTCCYVSQKLAICHTSHITLATSCWPHHTTSILCHTYSSHITLVMSHWPCHTTYATLPMPHWPYTKSHQRCHT